MMSAINLDGYETIDSAPRDGTPIEVASLDDDAIGPIVMLWDKDFRNPLVGNPPGIWVTPDRNLTWDESHGAGPTHWRRLKS